MQFALPPRKTSQPPLYARTARVSPNARLRQLKVGTTIVVGVLALVYLISRLFGSSEEWRPKGTPNVVIVTVFDHNKMSKEYIHQIKQNRDDYARRHGYTNFYTNTTTYRSFTTSYPSTWSLIPAVHHAMTLYPYSPWFFALNPNSVIMEPSLSLESHVTNPARLASLMQKDIPVVPPDSVIHTFGHLKPEKVDLILTQDAESLCHGSFLLRKGEWARFFLDVWGDLLYRKYNFQKAEKHALEHVVQWHPTILTKLVLVPQRIMNSYSRDIVFALADSDERRPPSITRSSEGTYREGDFLVRLTGCEFDSRRNCEKEMKGWLVKWKNKLEELDGRNTPPIPPPPPPDPPA